MLSRSSNQLSNIKRNDAEARFRFEGLPCNRRKNKSKN